MTNEELQMLAKLIASEMKRNNPRCPLHGVTQEQVGAIRSIADGINIVSKRRSGKLPGRFFLSAVGLIGYGIIAMIAEAYNKIQK